MDWRRRGRSVGPSADYPQRSQIRPADPDNPTTAGTALCRRVSDPSLAGCAFGDATIYGATEWTIRLKEDAYNNDNDNDNDNDNGDNDNDDDDDDDDDDDYDTNISNNDNNNDRRRFNYRHSKNGL